MSATLHERRCLDVLHASNIKDFKRQIVDFAQGLGFETVGAIVITRHSPTLVEYQSVTNPPDGYADEFSRVEPGICDPVLSHCSRSGSPFVWDRRDYLDSGAEMLWERQEPFGYRSGIAIAMHFAHGRHFLFGTNWSKDRCECEPNFKSKAEDVLSFAAHAQAAAFQLSTPTRPDPDGGWLLTRSELRALQWTMDGLSNREVGQKMALSACDVMLRLRSATGKLGCGTKYEAVLKAIRLGLINAS